jgi:hypothetical protein
VQTAAAAAGLDRTRIISFQFFVFVEFCLPNSSFKKFCAMHHFLLTHRSKPVMDAAKLEAIQTQQANPN